MKYLILSILLVVTMSCDKEESEQQSSEIVGQWQLKEVVSGWTNQTTDASELGYEEFYEFRPDSTMRKFRSNGDAASGTYSIQTLSDGKYIEVVYDDENTKLRESCGGNEFLRVEKNQLMGGSLPCDGPGLNYVKVESTKE
ncbi:MAG: hypothetical protein ABJH05_03325 [Fulvivirga sp.]